MPLREDITSDPEALQEPSVAFTQLQKLSPDQWARLMRALQEGDRELVAQIFGATPEQMDRWYKALKRKALEIVKAHPGLSDPTKGFGK